MKNKLEVKITRRSGDSSGWTVDVYGAASPLKKKVQSKMFNSRDEMRKYIESLKGGTSVEQ